MMMVMTMGGDTHGGDDDLYIAGHMCPEAVFFVTKKCKKTALGDLSRMSC